MNSEPNKNWEPITSAKNFTAVNGEPTGGTRSEFAITGFNPLVTQELDY